MPADLSTYLRIFFPPLSILTNSGVTMVADIKSVVRTLQRSLAGRTIEEVDQLMMPKMHQMAKRVPHSPNADVNLAKERLMLTQIGESEKLLLDDLTVLHAPMFEKNIENFIGTVKVPVGLCGPLRVNGIHAQGDFYLPLATTEAALVASYTRGAKLISMSGGCSVAIVNEGVTRAPGFAFTCLNESGKFLQWVTTHLSDIKRIAESTSRFGMLTDVNFNIDGNHVYMILEYATGDASGQNMVTIATQAVCNYIVDNCPVKPRRHYVESNLSSDKKGSAQTLQGVRGKKVTAEVTISEELLKSSLHVGVDDIIEYWRMSAIGAVISGTIGIQGHFANGLAALYLACGQDVACVAESAVGITRMEPTDNHKSLYTSVSLPNIIVGTVGGGTGLPSQRACLEMMGLFGANNASAFAEVAAGLILAGELSIIGALAAGEFTQAHARLARTTPSPQQLIQ